MSAQIGISYVNYNEPMSDPELCNGSIENTIRLALNHAINTGLEPKC